MFPQKMASMKPAERDDPMLDEPAMPTGQVNSVMNGSDYASSSFRAAWKWAAMTLHMVRPPSLGEYACKRLNRCFDFARYVVLIVAGFNDAASRYLTQCLDD